MSWLLVPALRPQVLLAAGASLVLNLMLLVLSMLALQVFERAFASRSLEALAMLCILTVIALAY